MTPALMILFGLHAVSASLALGLPFVVAWYDRRRPELAQGLVTVTLVNLSAAVVLGVGALLFITVLWPRPFVGAAVAHFYFLMSVVPLLGLSYAALYAYQLGGWRPGPVVAGLAILAVAGIFAAISAHSFKPAFWARLAHFGAAGAVASGLAVMVRYAGTDDARRGARLAFGASILHLATGFLSAWTLTDPLRYATGTLAVGMGTTAGGLVLLLGALAFAKRVTRTSAILASAGFVLVSLTTAVLREAIRAAG